MDIRLSRPCVDDPTRFIAECHLGKRVLIDKLCELLRGYGAKGLKCSVKLGVARFELEEKSVMIYSGGRVDIRKILNTGEAIDVMEKITDLIKEALSDKSS